VTDLLLPEALATPPNPATTNWVPVGPSYLPAASSVANIGARVYRSTIQSVPNAAFTSMSFDTVRWDSSGHWSVGSPTRLTCQVAGVYQVWGDLQYALSTTGGNRMALILLNGAIRGASNAGSLTVGSANPDIQASALIQMNVGDYVELQAYHDSGGALNISASSGYQNEFGMALVGGAPGPPGPGVPSPVVNGQWIKGVGGAAVWAAIAQADLPANLQGIPATGLNDYNVGNANGWYWANAGAANGPPGGNYCLVHVVTQSPNHVRQHAYPYGGEGAYTRRCTGGTWTAWRADRTAVVTGTVNADGTISQGNGFTVAHPGGGNYTVTITNGYSSNSFTPLANARGQSVVCGTAQASATTFAVYMTTPSAWIDAPFSFAVFDAGTT